MGSNALTETAHAPFSLDAASHPGRLRYANARDLPGFPSIGLKKDGAAASTAAALGWMNAKPPQHWTPDISAAASAAALLANVNKMASAEGARRNAAGTQAAAPAADSARRQRDNRSPPSSTWGSSAANLAFRTSMAAPPAAEPSSLARQGSMRAAKGAMEGRRPRAKSSPMPKEAYPDQANAASNALSAATIAHRPSMRAPTVPVEEGGAVPWTTMDRRMFTSHPPVQPRVDEQTRNDVIHASAVAMAKRMYNRQQSVINTAHANAHARSSSFSRHGTGVADEAEPLPTFNNLQEAAYRLAQERLAKLQEEHQQNRELQEYYGSSGLPQRSKFGSLRGKLTRRRSASDGALVETKRRPLQIRKQMSLFDTKLAEADEKKRAQDRQALLAAAQRNVQARLRDMDEKIQEETGWVKPTNRDDWEWKARAAAQARIDAARLEEQRKVDIGGGKFMDRDAVEAIAAKRVQPLLDEINEKAELERERRAQQRADEESQREEMERNKAREKEIQDIHKKLKEQQKGQEKARKAEIKHEEKVRKAEIKQEEKAKKEDAKADRAEQKKLARGGKQREKEVIPPAPAVESSASKLQEKSDPADPEYAASSPHSRALAIGFPKRHSKQKSKDSSDKSPALDGEPAATPANKVRSWLKTHFGRPRSHSSPVAGGSAEGGNKKFIGGAALTRPTGRNSSTPSISGRRSASAGTSMREVAMAGRPDAAGARLWHGDEPGESSNMAARPISLSVPIPTSGSGRGGIVASAPGDGDSTSLDSQSISSLSSVDKFEEARTTLSEGSVTPPRFTRAGPEKGQASLVRGSRFSEILE